MDRVGFPLSARMRGTPLVGASRGPLACAGKHDYCLAAAVLSLGGGIDGPALGPPGTPRTLGGLEGRHVVVGARVVLEGHGVPACRPGVPLAPRPHVAASHPPAPS